MTAAVVTIGSEQAVATLSSRNADFAAKFCAAAELNHLARRAETPLAPEAMDILADVLLGNQFAGQRQRFFLFREAADTLARAAVRWKATSMGGYALALLKKILVRVDDYAHRAVSEALGALPLAIAGPVLKMPPATCNQQQVKWQHLLAANNLSITGQPAWKGRSLVVPVRNGVLVTKFARSGKDSLEGLIAEARWMDQLRSGSFAFKVPFAIPRPLRFGRSDCIRLAGIPWKPPSDFQACVFQPALVYLASADYFSYPNAGGANGPCFEQMAESLAACAWLLGYLAGCGVVHTSPIALFHNRVQRRRRRDRGRYQWFRSGRLDRWLESCRYPNLSLCGLRDFEHLESVASSGIELYRHLGTQLLSLVLVAASWFRNRRPDMVGRDRRGRPVDVRKLFDRGKLEQAVAGIYGRYHQGFTGSALQVTLPFDSGRLTERMIDEMGVDRHMEEVLRVADQNQMDRMQLEAFLVERGYSKDQAAGIKKGAADIVIISGPHLGGFNRPISLPELIEAVAAMSATCVADRFLDENGLFSAETAG